MKQVRRQPRLTCSSCKFQDHLFDLYGRYRPANDNRPPGAETEIVIPEDLLLMRPSTATRLAIALRAKGKARRITPDWMLDRLYSFRGKVVYSDGKAFCRCAVNIDAIFGDDGSFRWLQDFLEFAEHEPRQNMQERVLPRLQLIAVILMIDDPEIIGYVLA